MTEQEREYLAKLSGLIRVGRKRMGLTQMDLSARLGISQSLVSKMENGLLVMSAPQWFEFCALTGIPLNSLSTGYLDQCSPAVLSTDPGWNSEFKLHKRYQHARGSKARALRPLFAYFRQTLGEKKLDEYFRQVKTDPDFFLDLDMQVNLNFFMDLARELAQRGLLKPSDLARLTKSVTAAETHGDLCKEYTLHKSSLQLVTTLISFARRYECNFEYAVEDEKKNFVTISVRPEEHLQGFNYASDEVLGDFLCRYKRSYFERFTTYQGAPMAVLTEKECHFKGNEKCIYQLKAAS